MRQLKLGTVIAAIKWTDGNGTKVVIGSDSQVTVGDNRAADIGKSKLIQFKNFTVGVCGCGPIREVLELIREDKKIKKTKIKSAVDAGKFGKTVFAAFKKEVQDSPTSKDFDYGDIGPLLLATPTNIYTLMPDFSVLESDDFATTGGGGDIACGALEIAYSSLTPGRVTYRALSSAVVRSLKAACKRNIYCSEPLSIIEVH